MTPFPTSLFPAPFRLKVLMLMTSVLARHLPRCANWTVNPRPEVYSFSLLKIAAGTRLGPYEIVARVGAGGMGEVYRARDTRLNREVAIKVLLSDLSARPQLRERFDREARAMSKLSHPHICTLHDVGHQDGIDFLVMEYLEGETLADRLTKGPFPLGQMLRYGVEIAEALDKAHRQGLIHRDLKPGNIMLTKSGAKILDFGLAKYSAREADSGKRDASLEPTEQKPLTEEGTILGTIQYMAPEQLEGKEADARTDIFALGSVLYEMATGKHAFEGKSKASLIASIMDHDPAPISTIQPMTPPAMDRVVRTCLEKDPDERWQSAHDIARELKWISEPAGTSLSVPSGRKTIAATSLTPWIIAVVATAGAIFLATRMRVPQDAVPVVRTFIPPPPDARFVTSSLASLANNAGPVAISPDGRTIVFSALTSQGKSSLWVRPLNQLQSRALAGTEGASYPFWSADSQQVGFFAEGKLKKIAVSGGPPQTICEAERGRGGTWNASGVIIFSPISRSALYRVEASGGEPKPLTTLDGSRGDFSHRWPFFLPDNDHFLYLVQSASRVGSVTKGAILLSSLNAPEKSTPLVTANSSIGWANGHLLFCRERNVLAQPFDAKALRLGGEPIVVAQDVLYYTATGSATFSASRNGVLAYQAGTEHASSQLVWFKRDGTRGAAVGPPGIFALFDLSPDGTRVAVDSSDSRSGSQDVWIYDLSRNLQTRLTFGPTWNSNPVWSADGARVAFRSARTGPVDIYVKAASGTGKETLLFHGGPINFVSDWSSDGRFVTGSVLEMEKKTKFDIWIYDVKEGTGRTFLQTEFNEMEPGFSSDGRWIAYASDESGRAEVYVRPLPQGEPKLQVSVGGGSQPRWRGDGKELFYLSSELRITAVDTSRLPNLNVSPQPLFEVRPTGAGDPAYEVSADGRRFLISTPISSTEATPITVVVNWPAELRPN